MKTQLTYKTIKFSSREYAEKLRKESGIPCSIIAVDKLPTQFNNENLYGTSQYRSMDGDSMLVDCEHGVAEFSDNYINPRNNAEGSVIRSKTIYYLKDFIFDYKVVDRVIYTPFFTVDYRNLRKSGCCFFENDITQELTDRLVSLGFGVIKSTQTIDVWKNWIEIEGLNDFSKFMSENKDIMNLFKVKMTSR